MKKLSAFDKFVFILNSIIASILLFSFLSYFISPNSVPFISVISLFIPFLILINLLFITYWLLKLKRQFLISTLILIIGFSYVSKFYKFQEKKVLQNSDLKVMSYNVRMFNVYKWIEEENVDLKIFDFIKKTNPDILCLQDFNPETKLGFSFPYSLITPSKKNSNFGHAIFSKYKIINSGSLNFTNSNNNAQFIDIIRNNDTLRVYNVHLESLRINPAKEKFDQENSGRLKIRLENSFKKQTNQANLIIKHQENLTFKSIICGDFNNTAFSWVYSKIKSDKNDAFEVAGKGFGKTYDYGFPFRIDFILTDKSIEINNFETYDVKYSDHYPIMARLNLNDQD
ncbi:endonuclease/exonuclease/phosphatase family protein [Lutibacter sp.]|uniref:endonuclease/exonuclease/phosphatase family protein n=1 Tax=Lutibacter sp. TaxID=1925666 RepID=UPI002735C199|nr:endonuclease/exonuclease/phosphatase family protein [Lutibacter sp.]MDP3313089.1 endonuclease/exonuclease/phosphatase family protein [Lutibacter sp.]